MKRTHLLFLLTALVFALLSCTGNTAPTESTADTIIEKSAADAIIEESAAFPETEISPEEENEMKTHAFRDPRDENNVIIYDFSVTDFGAKADSSPDGGGTDNTDAFKKALDAAKKAGGGVVYVPAGYYRVDGKLTIPRSVCLAGEWYDPDTEPEKIAAGTVIVTSYGKGSENSAFITVGASASVMGLTFYYPDQDAASPEKYGATVLLKDNIAGDGTQHAANASCLTFVNSYTAIDASRGNQLHYVSSARITAFSMGFAVNECYDCGRVMSMSISPDYLASFITAVKGENEGRTARESAAETMKSAAVGVQLMRSDWQMMYDISIKSCKTAFSLLRNPKNTGETAGNGSIIDFSIEDCVTGIDCAYGSYQFSLGKVSTGGTSVILGDTAVSSFSFYDCTFSSANSEAVLAQENSRGHLSFQSCTFDHWAESGISVLGGSFESGSCTYSGSGIGIHIHPTARTASVDGSVWGDEITSPVVNLLEGENKTYIGSSEPLNKTEFVPDFGTPPSPNTSSVVYVTDFGADGKAKCGSDSNPDDTPAFEAAIAALENGGIVYVPAGYYNVAGTLTVPTGVEIRGIHTGLHVTTGEGSVIFVTNGKGEADGTPFITLESGSGVRGLTFWYPEQNYRRIVKYPWLIRSVGQDTWVRDICVGNCYQAIDMGSADCGGHYIENITGCVLKKAVVIDGSSRAGHLLNTHFNLSFYTAVWGTKLTDASGSFGSNDMFTTLLGTLNNSLEAYTFGSTVNENLLFIFNYRAAVGMTFTGGFDGTVCGSGVDGSVCGVKITGSYEKPLVLLNFTDDIVPGSHPSGNTAIYSAPDEGSEVHFVASGASSYNYVPPYLIRAVSGRLVLRGFNANVTPAGQSAALLIEGADVEASGITFRHVGPLDAQGAFTKQGERPKVTDVRIKSGKLALTGVTANYFFNCNTDKGECSALGYTVAE